MPECEGQSSVKRWRIINELLHAHQTDSTRTDHENRNLVDSFSDFFTAKITDLKCTIARKLASFTSLPSFDVSQHTPQKFHICHPVTIAEVHNIIKAVPPKCSSADRIPPAVVKTCPGVFLELIAELSNRSFREGSFPSLFKHAAVTSILKQPNLDKSDPSNYRPISNLDFISKIHELLFQGRIQPHVLSSPNFNKFQSAYRPSYSTETSLLSMLDSIFRSSDSGASTLLVSLDLSAAFDTIDHRILINRLSTSYGFSGPSLSWIQSYLNNRTQYVRFGRHSSSPNTCSSGVPQGSVLGPLLFNIYTSPVAKIANSFTVSQRQYADDTQLFISLSPSNFSSGLNNLTDCLDALHVWFCQNGMALNPTKSDAAIFGTQKRSHSYSSLESVNFAGTNITLSDHIKILGTTLDSHLTMDRHVSSICKSSCYHIRALRHIRTSITDESAKLVASSFTSARLDYANSILHGTSHKNIQRLQRVQNALARVVLSPVPSVPSDSLTKLHWLPVDYRINYKLAILT